MAENRKMPPLPGSTEEDFRLNNRHSFYGKTPREVWVKASIEHKPIVDKEKCPHRFRYTEEGVECEMCHMGLIGKSLIIKGDHLFYRDQQIF
jgi:hypothetical protein